MSTFQFWVGTVVLGSFLLALVWAVVRVAQWALPIEPPIDALYGDSLMTRMKALRHEHDAKYVVGGKPRY